MVPRELPFRGDVRYKMEDGIRNAIITKTHLTMEEHGFLQGCISLKYNESLHQGFGYFDLRELSSVFISNVLLITGARSWESLVGVNIRGRVKNGLIQEIGHILEDRWFCPKKEM